jgi:hypothetical protein
MSLSRLHLIHSISLQYLLSDPTRHFGLKQPKTQVDSFIVDGKIQASQKGAEGFEKEI